MLDCFVFVGVFSQDVLNRWTYPLVPEKHLSERDGDQYAYGRHNIYLHSDVTLARLESFPMHLDSSLFMFIDTHVLGVMPIKAVWRFFVVHVT